MSAIEFVVRGDTGVVERGSVAGAGGDTSIIVGAGQEISLNLSRDNVLSYVRQGQALQVTLVDGQTITIEGYFSPEGVAENELFISANSQLSKVDLVAGEGNLLFAQYIDSDDFGKWSPNDDLYFVRGSEVQVAGLEAADAEAGMLFAPLLGGLGGLSTTAGLAGLGLGAAALAAGAAGAGDAAEEADPDEPTDPDPEEPTVPTDPEVDPEPPTEPEDPTDPTDPVDPVVPDAVDVSITTGTQGAGHVVNGDDYDDGIDIGGTGTPGASGVITVGGVSQNVEVDGSGNWTASFDDSELPDGDYELDVSITLTSGDATATATDVLDVDTVVDVSVAVDVVETDGTVSFAEESDGVTITGSTDVGSTVVVTVDGNDYDAVVTGGSWSVDLDAGVIAQGEYDLDVTVTATDEYGNSATTTDIVHIDTVTSVTIDTSAAGGDGTVNRDEHADGVAVNGLAEANASVEISLGGFATETVTANADGAWSYTFDANVVPTGTTDVTVTAVSTDAVGNQATASGNVHIDTDLDVTVDTSTTGGDGTVNILEHSNGVVLSGTADAESIVTVTFGTGTHTVTSDVNGNWSSNFTSTEIPTGETTATVYVSARDDADNVSTTTGTVVIDTVIDVNVDTSAVGGIDNVVNAAEHPNGVILTGFANGADTVSVNFGGAVHNNVAVNADGSWTSVYNSSEYTTGEDTVNVTVTATDAAGNSDTDSGSVVIDTFVNRLDSGPAQVEGDDVVTRAEASDGVTMTGRVEEGSDVFVTLHNNDEVQADVDSNGNWTVTFAAGDIPQVESSVDVVIRAVDAAGNEASITDSFYIDTVAPDAVDVESVTTADEATLGFTMLDVATGETVSVSDFENGSDAAATAAAGGTYYTRGGDLGFEFDEGAEVPDGSHLIVTATDEVGNTNSTMVVLDEDGNSVVEMSDANVDGFNIGAIDLEFADDSELTLSVDDLVALSDNDNSLIVHGGTDDVLTLDGAATKTGTQTINEQEYDVYSVGDAAGELIVSQDIDFNQSVI